MECPNCRGPVSYTHLGDEGGFAPALDGIEDALDSICQAIKDAGYEPGKDVKIAIDVYKRQEYVAFRQMKPKMMQEAIENAEQTAAQCAENSKSKIDKIMNADQGQFSIEDRDSNTP